MYDDADGATAPIDTPEQPAKSGSSISWPTVLMAGGVAAIVSAIVVTIGVVGILISERDDNNSASSQQPTVVNLGAATQQATPGAPAGAASSATPAPATTTTAAAGLPPAALPPVGAGQPTTPAAPAAPTTQSAARTTPTTGQLQAELDYLVSGASNQQKGQRLEGGARAAQQASGVAALLSRFKPLGVTYAVVGPVTTEGDDLQAYLELRSPGMQPAKMPLRWVWRDGRWKLTNKTVCDLGSYAQIPCSL